jgi:hypothetical protein
MYKTEAFKRLKWSPDSAGQQSEAPVFDGRTIHLNPMQIRSFQIKLLKH